MTGMQVIFIVDALVTVFAALMMVTAKKLMHAALWLVLTLLGVTVLFGLLEAGFFAVIQVVIYIGAIAILIIFAVMLTRDAVDDTYKKSRLWIVTAVLTALLFAGVALALFTWPDAHSITMPLKPEQFNVAELGMALVDPQKYVVPFEVASILLLAALVGAVYVSLDRKKGEE